MSSIKKILISISLFVFSLVCVTIAIQGAPLFVYLQYPGLIALVAGFFVLFAGIADSAGKQ